MELLEREVECAALEELVRVGGLVVFEGPPGAGTSALLEELGRRAAAAGAPLARVRASEAALDVPFGVARRLLEPWVRQRPAVLERGWARYARPLFAGDPGPHGMLVDGLIALVDELMRTTGKAILAVDHAHLADDGTLRFLAELGEREGEIGAGVAISARTGVERPALARLRAVAAARVLTPAPLSASAVRALAGAEELGARVLARSGGNPQLVAELLAAGPDAADVPVALMRLVRRRLDALPPAARPLAQALAILGEAPLRRAAALAELPGQAAEAAADALAACGVLAAGEPLRFRQPVVADVLTTRLPAFDLAARHRRAARLLADEGEPGDAVAAHLMQTRPAGDAWTCGVLRRAAASALGRGAASTAARLLERALAEPPPAGARGELVLELARAQAAAAAPEAIDRFEQALDEVREAGRRPEAWHGLSRLLYARGDHARAAAAAARGLAELGPGDRWRERLLADELAGAILCPALWADAAARTEALIGGPPPSEPALLAQLIVHQAWRGIAVERLPALARAAVAADPLVDPESRGFALAFVAGALNMVDETGLAGELLDAGLRRPGEDPLAEVSLRCCRAWTRIHAGRLRDAERDLDAAQAASRLRWRTVDGLVGPPLVVLRLELGDLPGARAALRRAEGGAQPGLSWFAGAVALAAGDAQRALTAFQAAGEELEGMLGAGNPGVLPWRSGAALAALRLGRDEDAQELAAAEVEQARAVGVPRALGIALRTLGRAARDTERLEESVAVLERSPARLELARTLVALGTSYRRERRARDARAPLGRGLDTARDCGATPLAATALTELRAAGGRPRGRPRSGRAALTASERRVAELAAAGRTTRQIAGELFLSPKTVEGQLTSAYRKLGVSSRGELEPLLRPSR